jgi:hypothetical protein
MKNRASQGPLALLFAEFAENGLYQLEGHPAGLIARNCFRLVPPSVIAALLDEFMARKREMGQGVFGESEPLQVKFSPSAKPASTIR